MQPERQTEAGEADGTPEEGPSKQKHRCSRGLQPAGKHQCSRGLQLAGGQCVLPPSPQAVLTPGSWCKDPANSLTVPINGSEGSPLGPASSDFQQGSSPGTVIGTSCK